MVAGHDAVVHLAGIAGLDGGTAEQIYTANTLGTFLVMEAAGAGRRREAGVRLQHQRLRPAAEPAPGAALARYPWDEDEPADIADAYSLSKQANEAAAHALSAGTGWP